MKENIDFIIPYSNPNKLLEVFNEQTQMNKTFETTEGYGICANDKTEAFIYLQNGCTNNCTFCKFNYLNKKLLDMPLEKVKRFIDELNDEKVKYIQFRALNVCQYGLGLYGEPKLMELCEYIEGKNNIKSVELGGFAFGDAIKYNFADKIKYLKKTNLINGSLESGSDRLLKLMNKGFTMEEFWDFYSKINSINKKDFILSIISGFPTETVDDCLETISVLKKIKPLIVNINTYFDSTYVPAHSLEQLTEEEINEHTKMYTKAMKKSFTKCMVNLK